MFERYSGATRIYFIIGHPIAQVKAPAGMTRSAIAALEILHPSRVDGLSVVTASIGVSHVTSGAAARSKSVLAAADEALYAAKRRVRNRWVPGSAIIAVPARA